MSYLAEPTSKTSFGVVTVGNYIDVANGVISLSQDLGNTANVTFANITTGNIGAGNVYSNGNLVVTSVTPVAGPAISISNLVSTGQAVSFKVNNTGVHSLVAGAGISLSANVGNIVISSFGADLMNVTGVTTSYTATLSDEYIGVSSANAVTITLPAGIDGRVYYIKDEFGQGSGKITIQPQSGELIDGKINYVISVPYQSVNPVFRSGKWWII